MWTSKFLLYFYGKALLIRKYNQYLEKVWVLTKLRENNISHFSSLCLCKYDFKKIHYFDKHSDDVCVEITV